MSWILGRGFVDMGVETGGLQSGLARASNQFRNFARGVEQNAMTIVAATAGVTVAFARIFRLAGQQEQAEFKLRAALRATGQEVDNNAAELMKQAAALQAVTRFGDEATIKAQSYAIQLGFTAQQSQAATIAAAGLASMMGGDLNSAMRTVTQAMAGNFTTLQRYVPAIRSATTEQEKQAAAMKFFSTAFEVATSEVETGLGAWAQIVNILGDIGEVIGESILPIMRTMRDWLAANNETITILARSIGPWAVGIGSAVVALGALALVVVKVSSAVATLTAGIAALVAGTGIAGLVAIATAAIGVFVLWQGEGDTLSDKLRSLGENIQFVVDSIGVLAGNWRNVLMGMAAQANIWISDIVGTFGTLVQTMAEITGFDWAKRMADSINGLVDSRRAGWEKVLGERAEAIGQDVAARGTVRARGEGGIASFFDRLAGLTEIGNAQVSGGLSELGKLLEGMFTGQPEELAEAVTRATGGQDRFLGIDEAFREMNTRNMQIGEKQVELAQTMLAQHREIGNAQIANEQRMVALLDDLARNTGLQ